MKAITLLPLLTFAVLGLQAAPKDEKLAAIPKESEGRWGIYSFEDAKKEALKKKQPIAFILNEERAEELAVIEGAKKAFWGLEKYATMVVLNSSTAGKWKTLLPEACYTAVSSKDLGKEYPKLVVVDQNCTVQLGKMSSDEIIKSDEKLMKEFGKSMDDANKNPPAPTVAAAPAAPAAPATPATTVAPAMPADAAPAAGNVLVKDARADNWTNTEGRTISAAVLEIAPDKVVFQMANGSKVDYPIANLNDESKKRLEDLKAASVK
jgi:hypothetical protein